MKKASLSSVILVFMAFSMNAQTHNSLSPRTKKVLDSTYTALIKKNKVVGMSLAIVDSGKIVYSIGYGFRDLENKIKANDSTIYRIGSCTKSFTSLSILQLQEKGKLQIEHSVKKYLPELNIQNHFGDNNPICIRDMMTHVSGLPCDVSNGFFCDSPPNINWLIQELNKQYTISPHRYKRAYSNVAYGLLGEVVAREGGLSYSNYVKEKIFKPLKMHSSYIELDTILVKQFSKAYVRKKITTEPLIRDEAAGLIHSTVLDMSNYLLMYLKKGEFENKYLLSPDGIDEMFKNQISDIDLYEGDNWGYGLYSNEVSWKHGNDSNIVNLIGHGGDTYAYHADFGFIPELGVGVVLLTNTDKGVYVRSASKLLKLYLKTEKKILLNTAYKAPKDSSKKISGEINCSGEFTKGVYNMNDFLIKVTNTSKIKFSQGPATVVLRQKENNPDHYKLKARVFGIIPIKIKDQEFKFVNRNGKIYAKAVFVKSGDEEYVGLKSEVKEIPSEWKKAFGKYELATKAYDCTNCAYSNPKGLKMVLKENKGFVKIITKSKSIDLKGNSFLELVDNHSAQTGGIGRGNGETVRILENGNVYFSGFEFKKVN